MTQKNDSATILIIDDTPSNLGMVVNLLEGRGYRVAIAQDGEEGLQRAQLLQPDLILLDVMMPGADGFEICGRLKALEATRDIPVMFMTALASTEHKIKGFAAGGVDYLTKPLQVDEVMARVDTHIKLHTAQQRLVEQNAQLQAYQEELELRVAERTAELSVANLQLRVEVEERKQAEQALEESRALLRSLAVRTQENGEEERKYVARELHEELAQVLVGLKLNLSALALQQETRSPLVREQLQQNMTLTDSAISVARNISSMLRPVALDMGIASALEWLSSRFGTHMGIQCEVHIEENEIQLGENHAIALFRIVQEGLNNVALHAQADKVDVALERDATDYVLKIRDNGIGFDVSAKKADTLGLLGIQERVLALGGTVSIISNPGRGTEITVRMPVPTV